MGPGIFMRLASPCRVHALRLADVAHENRPTTRESSRGRKRFWPIVDVAQAKRGLVWRKTNSTSASKWQCAWVLERPASQSGETQAAGKFRSMDTSLLSNIPAVFHRSFRQVRPDRGRRNDPRAGDAGDR